MAYDKDEVFNKICEEISLGRTLTSICKDKDMPNKVTFFRWLENNPDKCNQYARAKDIHADSLADEIREISNHTSEDHTPFTGGNVVQRDRLRIDALKWLASKIAPKKYGDKFDVTSNSETVKQVFVIGGQEIVL